MLFVKVVAMPLLTDLFGATSFSGLTYVNVSKKTFERNKIAYMYLFTLKKAVYKSDQRIGPLDRHNVSCLDASALQRRDNRISADLIWSSFPRLILFMDVWVFFNSQNSLKTDLIFKALSLG